MVKLRYSVIRLSSVLRRTAPEEHSMKEELAGIPGFSFKFFFLRSELP